MSAALKGQTKRGTALYEMVGLYAPQGVDLGWDVATAKVKQVL